MATHDSSTKSRWLHRGRLRDAVIVLCLASAFVCPLPATALDVALGFFAVGCLLHVLVKGQLIRNVTLCTEGAYAVVRHPYYLANYLVDISFCLLSGNVYLVLVYPFLFYWAYGPTFAEEEATLKSIHGERFDTYRESVPQVFPTTNLFAGLRSMGRGLSWRRISAKEIKRIFRFGFVALLLILAREVGVPGLHDLAAGHLPENPPHPLLFGLCFACLIISLAIPSRREEHGSSWTRKSSAS